MHFVVPDGIDDPDPTQRWQCLRPPDRRGTDRPGLVGGRAGGPGVLARRDAAGLARLAAVIGAVPDGGVVLVDGLIASAAGRVLRSHAPRVRMVVLMHMPLFDRSEGEVLAAATP